MKGNLTRGIWRAGVLFAESRLVFLAHDVVQAPAAVAGFVHHDAEAFLEGRGGLRVEGGGGFRGGGIHAFERVVERLVDVTVFSGEAGAALGGVNIKLGEAAGVAGGFAVVANGGARVAEADAPVFRAKGAEDYFFAFVQAVGSGDETRGEEVAVLRIERVQFADERDERRAVKFANGLANGRERGGGGGGCGVRG